MSGLEETRKDYSLYSPVYLRGKLYRCITTIRQSQHLALHRCTKGMVGVAPPYSPIFT